MGECVGGGTRMKGGVWPFTLYTSVCFQCTYTSFISLISITKYIKGAKGNVRASTLTEVVTEL
jgi:hypothetical protein